jgi:uncharacterized protein YndB with AHSA1/START domain
MAQTRITQHVKAPRDLVYRAILDPAAVATWMVPDGMRSEVLEFDAREGGNFRISLTYQDPTERGKTTAEADTFHGRFVILLANQRIEEELEFETEDPALKGEMSVTFTLSDAPHGGTEVLAVHDRLPAGLSEADNELGWRMSLRKLAGLVESQRP